MTVEQIISDIEAQLMQGAPSDDSELSWDQLKAWVTYHLNALVTAECNAKMTAGEGIPPIYIKHQDAEVMLLEDAENDDKLYVLLPERILNLKDDRGVLMVLTEDGDEINPINLEDMVRVKKMRFAKPGSTNPLRYRRGNRVYIEGFKPSDIPFEKVVLYYIPEQDLLLMDDLDDVAVSEAILPTLIDTVVQRGKLQMYGTQADQMNDGVDNKQTVYHTAVSKPENETE